MSRNKSASKINLTNFDDLFQPTVPMDLEKSVNDNQNITKQQIYCVLKVKVKSLSRVQLFATPWTVAHQPPPSMGFSRQEYWSGLPFPSPMHESEK